MQKIFKLSELHQIFYNRKHHCKLDWQFRKWDQILNKFRIQIEQNPRKLKQGKLRAIKQKARKFISNLRIEFDVTRATFESVVTAFSTRQYPFNLDAKQREDFDAFMTKYIIDERFFSNGHQLYSLEDILNYKKPKLTKYMGRQDTAQSRIIETWKQIGPITRMKDKVGHRFLTILLRNMQDTFGDRVKLRLMTVEEARSFNKKYYPQDYQLPSRKFDTADKKDAKKFRSAVMDVKQGMGVAELAGGNSSPAKINYDAKQEEKQAASPFMFGLGKLFNQKN